MEYRFLKYKSTPDGIGTLTISRPEALNALNRPLLDEINDFIDNIPADLRLLIITGEGKSFVAGADIAAMAPMNKEQGLEFGKFGSMVFRKIEELPIPVIAAVNGFALGGGCELAMSCDIRIASEKARFGQPEVKLGIIPGFNGTYRLAKLIGQGYAKEMIYSGGMINAAEALRIGLVNHVVPCDQLEGYVKTLAEIIVANAPIAIANAKKSINENYDLDKPEAIALENGLFAECFATEDQKIGMKAFLEKKSPEFKNK